MTLNNSASYNVDMKKIIVAPINMHQGLLEKSRLTNPFVDIKIIDKNTLINDYFGRLKKGSDILVFKNFDLTYEMINEILNDILFFNDLREDKYSIYKSIKDFLVSNDMIINDSLFSAAYQNKDIEIYNYHPNDRILNFVLSKVDSKINFVTKDIIFKNKNVNSFKFAYDESLFVLNEIARLLDEGVSINDIFIFNPSSCHKYYLEKYAESFGLKINNLEQKSLFTSGLCIDFLKIYDEIQDIGQAVINLKEIVIDDQNLEQLLEVISKNTAEGLSFLKQRELLLHKFKNTFIKRDVYKPAINIIDGPIYRKDAHIFVMDFSLNSAPIIFKDNAYLSDLEKEGTFIYTSKEKNENARNELLDFLSSDNNFYFSRSSIVDNSNSYPTSFVEEFGLNIVNEPEIITFYSQLYLDIKYTEALDKERLYLQKTPELIGLKELSNIKYHSYDNQFTGVDAIKEETPLRLSFSSLDSYYACPFKYYLNHVLKLGTFESNFAATIGDISHEVFKHQYEDDFDFDLVFEETLRKFELSAMEMLLIKNLKSQIKRASDISISHIKEFSSNPKVYCEKEVIYKIDEYTALKGIIDKIVTLDNRYYYLVDYKTGAKSFSPNDLEYGRNSQLITYMLLADQIEELDNMQISGIFYNNVINKELVLSEKDEENLVPSYLKLKGRVIKDSNVIQRIDKSFINSNAASFIGGVGLKNDGGLKASNTLVSQDELDSYKQIVRELINKTIISIRNNDFKIKPIFYTKDENACKYCEYRELCYLRYEQKMILGNLEEESGDGEEME